MMSSGARAAVLAVPAASSFNIFLLEAFFQNIEECVVLVHSAIAQARW
jgi:hypothetical protein